MTKFMVKLALTNCLLLISGCTYGILYTDTVEPYCTDMDNTLTLDSTAHSPIKQISIPTLPGATVRWDNNTIHDMAKAAGIKKIAYCDRKLYSVLLGLWEEDYLIIYGE